MRLDLPEDQNHNAAAKFNLGASCWRPKSACSVGSNCEFKPWRTSTGRVDGFDQDKAGCEVNEGQEVGCGFFAAWRDPFEALELADRLLDARSSLVKRGGKEGRFVSGVGFVGRRHDAALTCCLAIGVAALVSHGGTRSDVGAEIREARESVARRPFLRRSDRKRDKDQIGGPAG